MKILLCLTALLFVFSVEARGVCIVQTEKAKYCGEQMILEGKVALENPLGKVFADKAILYLADINGRMEGNVVIETFDGAQLKCEYAVIDHDKASAHFSGDHVEYKDGKQLSLRSKQMRLFLTPLKDLKQEIASIHALNEVEIDQDEEWTLLAEEALYHKDKQEVTLSSKEDKEQLFFHDYNGKIYADHATVKLDKHECILTGNVKLIQREGLLEQYATADKVVISKNSGKMHFYSGKTQRVLFFDRVNNLQVSAPELILSRDPVTRQENVKGKGNVRFHFKEEEYERFKLIFANRDND